MCGKVWNQFQNIKWGKNTKKGILAKATEVTTKLQSLQLIKLGGCKNHTN